MRIGFARKAPSEVKATEFTMPSAGITTVSRRWSLRPGWADGGLRLTSRLPAAAPARLGEVVKPTGRNGVRHRSGIGTYGSSERFEFIVMRQQKSRARFADW